MTVVLEIGDGISARLETLGGLPEPDGGKLRAELRSGDIGRQSAEPVVEHVVVRSKVVEFELEPEMSEHETAEPRGRPKDLHGSRGFFDRAADIDLPLAEHRGNECLDGIPRRKVERRQFECALVAEEPNLQSRLIRT